MKNVRRKKIKENDYAIIEKVGNDEYQYWVYEITPIRTQNIDGINITTGGVKMWHGMYKTLEEATKEYELLSEK